MSFHHQPKIVTNGLINYLDCSNIKSYPGSGNNWYDLKGGTATLTGGVSFVDGNMYFDGNDGVVALPFAGFSEITYSMWVLKDFTNYRRATKLDAGPSSDEFIMVWPSNGEFGVYIGGGTPSPGYHTSLGAGLNTTDWAYVTWSYEKTTLKLYKNGVYLNEVAVARATDFEGGKNINIGSPYGNATEDWVGNINVVQVYDRVLTTSEILQNYNALKSRYL
jgi:hypothetical protein